MNAVGRSIPFVILMGGVLGLMGLMSLRKSPPSASRENLPPLVETLPAESCEQGFSIKVDGTVVPYREITLAALVQGQIKEKSQQARAGKYIAEGDLLFEIDPQDYELAVKRLREEVKQASSNIEISDVEKSNTEDLIKYAEERLELQRKEVRRFEELMKKGATSASQLEKARSAELQSLDQLEKLKGQINIINANRVQLVQAQARANASLEKAILDLNRSSVYAPSAGMIMEDMAEQDDFVQVGAPLVRIEDTSKTEVRFSLRMDQLRWLWQSPDSQTATESPRGNYELPAAEVLIWTEIDGNRFCWKAKLDRYDGAGINDATRTIPLIAVVDNPSDVTASHSDDALPLPAPPTLLRNTFVTVELPVAPTFDLVKVPLEGLRPDGRVWTMKDGKLHRPEARVAAQSADDKVILLAAPSQLAAGDRVIVSPLPPLPQPGMGLREQTNNSPLNSATVTTSGKQEDTSL